VVLLFIYTKGLQLPVPK